MRIFIAGCARSGTSLTRGLMGCFAETYTHGAFSYDQEAAESFFDKLDRPEKHVVIKRVASSHHGLPRLSPDIGLLYCVRHPFDVLTSAHPDFPDRRFYVSEPRWRAEYAAYRLLRALQPARRIFVLRYEDLVAEPDAAQARIAAHFGLDIARPFSANREGVAVGRGSVEKWRRDPALRDYLDTFDAPFLRVIDRFCAAFGYTLPARYRWWFPAEVRRRPVRALRHALARPRVLRLEDNPIVRPEMLPGKAGRNINGPSLVRAPRWLKGRLGRFHLYFAHHSGSSIRLAYADALAGPWRIHGAGTLQLSDAPMCRGHIASPDVHVDEAERRVRMYFHGPVRDGEGQRSFVALSSDGLAFTAAPEVLAGPYLRAFAMDGAWFGIDQDGHVYRSPDGLTGFVRRAAPLGFVFADVKATHAITVRHLALQRVGPVLHVFYTRRGDAPERIWRGTIDLVPDWDRWRMRDEMVVLSPERPWEGADLAVLPSEPGAAKRFLHELRDPAVFTDRGRSYLLYAVAGEAGIAVARLG